LIKKKFGEHRERERNLSTYLPLIDYIKAYDDADRGKKCKKLRGIWRTITLLEVIIFRRKL